MPTVILVSADDDWHAPLAAMLREAGVTVALARDPFDVLPLLGETPEAPVIVGPDLDAATARLLLGGLARRLESPVVLLCGKGRDGLDDDAPAREAGFVGVVGKPWRFARLTEHIRELLPAASGQPVSELWKTDAAASSKAAGTPPPREGAYVQTGQPSDAEEAAAPRSAVAAAPEGVPARPAPSPSDAAPLSFPRTETWIEQPLRRASADPPAGPDRQAIERLLRLARHEDYFTLLGVGRAVGEDAIREAAQRVHALLDPRRVDPRLLDRYLMELAEIRGALNDAEAVLTSEEARRLYVEGLRVS